MFVETKHEGETTEGPLMPSQRDLLAAADLIERKGRTIGCLGDEKIGFCMVGALSFVASGRSTGMANDRALMKLCHHIGTQNVGAWNDSHTTEEALAALRAAAWTFPTG